jgi:predicted dehydrogenase
MRSPCTGSQRVACAFDAAERAGRLLMEAFMYRHHPDTHCRAHCISGGELGDVHQSALR